MNENLRSFEDVPGIYQIRVIGRLSQHLVSDLTGDELIVFNSAGDVTETIFVIKIADQSALLGVIDSLINTGHAVISVERLLSDKTGFDGDE
ncbi:MAG: hypothetical protein R6X18_01595 [Chloroflexota bacterium]|jgi:hypothetical protein